MALRSMSSGLDTQINLIPGNQRILYELSRLVSRIIIFLIFLFLCCSPWGCRFVIQRWIQIINKFLFFSQQLCSVLKIEYSKRFHSEILKTSTFSYLCV